MPLEAGAKAPQIETDYPDNDGEPHNLVKVLEKGPMVLGIYKSSCAASKAMMPVLNRIEDAYGEQGATVIGVAQDSPNVTKSFKRRTGTDYTILIEGDDYPISREFDIFATPTVYVIDKDGTITYTTMGFMRNQVNDIGNAVADILGVDRVEIVSDKDDEIPAFVPG